jgi:hypothetical protein
MADSTEEASIPPGVVINAKEGFVARYAMTPADELFSILAREGYLTVKAYVELAQRYEG